MKHLEHLEQILENASTIQYYQNVLDNNEDNDIVYNAVTKQYAILAHGYTYDGYEGYLMPLDKSVAKFLLKGRTLKSGIATPMARYYAYKALGLSHEQEKTFESKLWACENQAFKRIKVEDILTYEEETLLF